MDHWQGAHPTCGLVEVYVGTPEELREIDPRFPEKASGKPYLVCVDGKVIARESSLQDRKIGLGENELAKAEEKLQKKDFYSEIGVTKPYVKLDTGLFGWLRMATVYGGGATLELDPPEGSKAAKRVREMEESPFKRWLYPLLAGMGKGGWAVFAIVVMPLLGRLIDRILDWLLQFVPDWEIPWPEINLPDINWPEINLPEINLPEIPWPDWELPHWGAPWIVEMAVEYSKVWIPIVIGIALGISSIRAGKKTREVKLQAERKRVASVLRQRLAQLEDSQINADP